MYNNCKIFTRHYSRGDVTHVLVKCPVEIVYNITCSGARNMPNFIAGHIDNKKNRIPNLKKKA